MVDVDGGVWEVLSVMLVAGDCGRKVVTRRPRGHTWKANPRANPSRDIPGPDLLHPTPSCRTSRKHRPHPIMPRLSPPSRRHPDGKICMATESLSPGLHLIVLLYRCITCAQWPPHETAPVCRLPGAPGQAPKLSSEILAYARPAPWADRGYAADGAEYADGQGEDEALAAMGTYRRMGAGGGEMEEQE